MTPILSQDQMKDLSAWLAEEFDIDARRIEESIGDWYNEVHTEEAFEGIQKRRKYDQEDDDIDKEQEDLTNSQM